MFITLLGIIPSLSASKWCATCHVEVTLQDYLTFDIQQCTLYSSTGAHTAYCLWYIKAMMHSSSSSHGLQLKATDGTLLEWHSHVYLIITPSQTKHTYTQDVLPFSWVACPLARSSFRFSTINSLSSGQFYALTAEIDQRLRNIHVLSPLICSVPGQPANFVRWALSRFYGMFCMWWKS